jgi:hypothetical protein
MNPSTLIHRPLAKATRARLITNDGKILVKSTTRDSAASRSRNNQKTDVKKAVAVGWKLMSQYEITENTTEIRTT